MKSTEVITQHRYSMKLVISKGCSVCCAQLLIMICEKKEAIAFNKWWNIWKGQASILNINILYITFCRLKRTILAQRHVLCPRPKPETMRNEAVTSPVGRQWFSLILATPFTPHTHTQGHTLSSQQKIRTQQIRHRLLARLPHAIKEQDHNSAINVMYCGTFSATILIAFVPLKQMQLFPVFCLRGYNPTTNLLAISCYCLRTGGQIYVALPNKHHGYRVVCFHHPRALQLSFRYHF